MNHNSAREEGKAAKMAKEFIMMTLGTSLVSIGVYFFKFPNNFSMAACPACRCCWADCLSPPG